ncbi:collagen alpha-1(I) chain-like [Marmota marmota marmota]|uniref:collagen alpha-1(I) chain-like n=1 Tax=Marmota marmota marmota TaxID=9994 RepID=UPI00209210EF|nr:collagen alpha-1(I) chain-like [Marmota marmota marmota]
MKANLQSRRNDRVATAASSGAGALTQALGEHGHGNSPGQTNHPSRAATEGRDGRPEARSRPPQAAGGRAVAGPGTAHPAGPSLVGVLGTAGH